MKKLNLALVIFVVVVLSLSANAQDGLENSDQKQIQHIKNTLKSLNGRAGVFSSNFDKDNNGTCIVDVTENSTSLTLAFNGTGAYSLPIVHLFVDSVRLLDANTLLVSTSSDRPGGDACGDFGGAVNYKQILSVQNNTIQIQTSYRCSYEFFKKYKLVSTCSVQNSH